jgi:C-terminal processing protease CtpA/Prc
MKADQNVSGYLGHLAALAGTTLLGFAIASTHQTVSGQATDQKSPPSAEKAKAKNQQAAAEKRRERRGHALGMTVEAQDKDGISIGSVEEGGIAARAGLKQGDRIVAGDNRTFQHTRQFEAYLASHGGRPIPITILRDGRQQTIMYTPPFRAGDSAWLGVFLEEGDNSGKGARVTQVYPGGPAARAGLQPGDLITKVDDQNIESPADLIGAVAEMNPRSQAQFTVLRDQHEQQIPVTLGAYQHFMPATNGQPDNGQYPPGHDAFANVPPYAMQLEHDRRAAEQHERIENEIRNLREEIRQLREELKQKK